MATRNKAAPEKQVLAANEKLRLATQIESGAVNLAAPATVDMSAVAGREPHHLRPGKVQRLGPGQRQRSGRRISLQPGQFRGRMRGAMVEMVGDAQSAQFVFGGSASRTPMA